MPYMFLRTRNSIYKAKALGQQCKYIILSSDDCLHLPTLLCAFWKYTWAYLYVGSDFNAMYLSDWYVLEWLSRGICAGRSIMHYVASHAEGLEELLEVNGIQWDIKDKKGESLLHYAVSSNCPMSAFLLAKKIPAACLWTNEAGKNPMQLAQEKSFGEVRHLYASPGLFPVTLHHSSKASDQYNRWSSLIKRDFLPIFSSI